MDEENIKFSVLMSVYRKENPKWFQMAVESVINQTIKPDEIVIVQDGELTKELYVICDELCDKYPQLISFYPLEQNSGLGIALQRGVLACKNEYIARMDTDDIALPDRFEVQLDAFKRNPNIVICGGYIQEFAGDAEHINAMRKVPVSKDEIYTFCKQRNPFNHMTVMFKKSAVLSVGNYQPFLLLEDYYLWYRLIKKGYEMCNVPVPLVRVRADESMINRRGGFDYFKREMALYKEFYNDGYINEFEMAYVLLVRLVSRICPDFIRKSIYHNFLR